MQKGSKSEGWRKPTSRDEIEECLECGRTDCNGNCDRIKTIEKDKKKARKEKARGAQEKQRSPGYRTRGDLLAEIERLKEKLMHNADQELAEQGMKDRLVEKNIQILREMDEERLKRKAAEAQIKEIPKELEALRRENERLRRENEGLRMRIPLSKDQKFRVRDRATGTEYEGTKAELSQKMGKGKNEIADMIRHLMRYEMEVL